MNDLTDIKYRFEQKDEQKNHSYLVGIKYCLLVSQSVIFGDVYLNKMKDSKIWTPTIANPFTFETVEVPKKEFYVKDIIVACKSWKNKELFNSLDEFLNSLESGLLKQNQPRLKSRAELAELFKRAHYYYMNQF